MFFKFKVRRLIRRVLVLASALLATGPVASHAVVIHDTAGAAAAEVHGAPYSAVAYVDGMFITGTGTLITPNHILTASHLMGGRDPANYTIRFDADNDGAAEVTRAISGYVELFLLPSRGDVDLAILTLETPVTTIAPTPVFVAAPAIGETVSLVGYGRQGIGSEGAGGSDGTRWGGTNILDIIDNNLQSDFDSGSALHNALASSGSSELATILEATTAPGDSGGPLFNAADQLIGVLSRGSTPDSAYGDVSTWMRLDTHREWMESNAPGVVFVVPEPASLLLMLGVPALARRPFRTHHKNRAPVASR